MRDQDVISRLTEFHDHIQAPHTPTGEDEHRGKQLLLRRRALSVAAAAAAVVLTVGIVQAALPDDQGDLQPAGVPSHTGLPEPQEASPDDETQQDDKTWDNDKLFVREVRRVVAEVPGWSIGETSGLLTPACAGDWDAAAGWGGGSFSVTVNGERGSVWASTHEFPSPSEASQAVTTLVDNLVSCEASWQVQPVAETGAVLASSAGGNLIWFQQNGKEVRRLDAATSDGPPPLDVQVEIADLM